MSAIADRLEKHEAEWPKSSRHFYREQRTSMMDAERELRALEARVAILKELVELFLTIPSRTDEELETLKLRCKEVIAARNALADGAVQK